MCAKSSTGRTQPRRREISTTSSTRAELAHAAHHLDPERHGAILALEPLAQLAELLADRVDRLLARAAEQEAGVEDDDLGAGGLRDPGRVVEHPDRHVQLLAALGVAHEAGDRRVHREHDAALARASSPNARREVVVHPEAALEVDLAGACSRARAAASIAASGLSCDGTRAGPKCRAFGHRTRSLRLSVRPRSLPSSACPRHPSRIDLLELDIDLRLVDLWREAAGISEWSLEVVAAFMRAAYGKGYCDALTEEAPGSLCADHGYRVPESAARRRPTPDTPTPTPDAASAAVFRDAARLASWPARSAAPRGSSSLSRSPALLAIFLLYTAVAGSSTPTLEPSELAGQDRQASR